MDAGEALTFQDLAIESASREPDHRAAEAFGGGHLIWGESLEERHERPQDHIEDVVQSSPRPDAVHWDDQSWPDDCHGLEGHAEERVLGLPLHARPHDASLRAAVGACAGDENEGKAWIAREQEVRDRQGEVV